MAPPAVPTREPVEAGNQGPPSTSPLHLRNVLRNTGEVRDMPAPRLVYADMIPRQSLADGIVEGDLGVRVVVNGLDFGALAGGQIALRLNHQGHSGNTELEAVLLGFERLLREFRGR